MPSISGASRWLRPTPGASTSTSTREPISSSRRRGGDARPAARAARPAARPPAPRSTCAVEVGGVGAVLGRVGEEAAPVELRPPRRSASSCVVVGLGLARVADDEVRAERGRRARGRGCRRCGSRNRSPSPHRRMRRSSGGDTCCSDRSKYGHAGGADGVDQPVGEVRRVQVQQPDAVDPLGHRLDQRRRSARSPRRPGRARRRPGPGRRARSPGASSGVDLGEDVVDGPRPLRAAEATGWRRSRRPGRSPRPPSRRPTARSTGGRGRLSRSNVGSDGSRPTAPRGAGAVAAEA